MKPGAPIKTRLAIFSACFIVLMMLIGLFAPRLHVTRASVPTIAATKFNVPQQPIVTTVLQKTLAAPTPATSPQPKAQPTPCQQCQQAAMEVLTRYLTAIRTGAGADDREERPNNFEAPSLYPANHPVYVPGVLGNDQLRH
jgi:hypothetical protein